MNVPNTPARQDGSPRRASKAQLTALALVAAGRAEYGSEHPGRDRRAADQGRSLSSPTFLVDGAGIYGAQHATWQAIEAYEWILVRHDLVPMCPVAERVAEYTSVAGSKYTRVLPAHRAPADPGWRASVELTDAGRAVLEAGGAGR